MSTEIEMYAAATLPERWSYANAMATAGSLVPKGLLTGGQPDPGKIFWVAETASMLKLHPVAGFQGVNVIEGKPTLSPELMSAVIRHAGHKIRVSTSGQLADLSLTATAELIRSDDPDFTFRAEWTIARAQQAGLLTVVDGAVRARSRNGEPLPWEKYTAALLKARAIGEVSREGATDALMGVSYMPEELGAEVNEAGEMVQIEEAPARRPAPSADDYRPIALVGDTPTGESVVAFPAETGQTDPDMVIMYTLDRIATVEEARQAYALAQQNGHLDRPIDGMPMRDWLKQLAETFEKVQDSVDHQTGEVYEAATA